MFFVSITKAEAGAPQEGCYDQSARRPTAGCLQTAHVAEREAGCLPRRENYAKSGEGTQPQADHLIWDSENTFS